MRYIRALEHNGYKGALLNRKMSSSQTSLEQMVRISLHTNALDEEKLQFLTFSSLISSS